MVRNVTESGPQFICYCLHTKQKKIISSALSSSTLTSVFVSGSVVLLSKLPSKQDVCILSKWGCTMTSSFTFQWKLPFSEVAESLRSRFHLRTHSWEHHYMLYSAIKSSYFYCCKRQRLAEMSFAQPLNQFSGTQPVKLHGKLAA